jgi:hypothetical protein
LKFEDVYIVLRLTTELGEEMGKEKRKFVRQKKEQIAGMTKYL